MHSSIRNSRLFKRATRSPLYTRLRQYLPMAAAKYVDDRVKLEPAEVIEVSWPPGIQRPKFGIVQDYGPFPRWTKYRRLLETNGFDYKLYDLHAHDWMERALELDIILGFTSSEWWDLQEMRLKYGFLESSLGKATYPSPTHVELFENKELEAYICRARGLPFAPTYVSHSEADALGLIAQLKFPLVSKIVPGSGSTGVELVRSPAQAHRIIRQAFASTGRKTHNVVFRQKNYVYFQEYIPNDGYDLRIMVVGAWLFGYYRKVLSGDFRASGMGMVEKRELPPEAMSIALQLNQVIQSPLLVVDMVHAVHGGYQIIEFSPVCQMEWPEQLHVGGIPGVYVLEDDHFVFRPGRYWVHELALRQFLLHQYLPRWMHGCTRWPAGPEAPASAPPGGSDSIK